MNPVQAWGAPPRETGDRLLQIVNLRKWYPVYRPFPPSWLQRQPAWYVKAVNGVTLVVERGTVLGLAGESGSGKTTLGEIMIGLQKPTTGSVHYRDMQVEKLRGVALRRFRRHAQMVVQDPYQALNPHFQVRALVEEPLVIHAIGQRRDRESVVRRVLHDVGLHPFERYATRWPHELSGGERQRVSIARALVLQPEFLVLDEPTSMLDVSLRGGLLNLLQRLQVTYQLTMVIISHDITVLGYMCHRIAIMYLGEVVEQGSAQVVLENPAHPYTQRLIAAVPDPDPRRRRIRVGAYRNDPRGQEPAPMSQAGTHETA